MNGMQLRWVAALLVVGMAVALSGTVVPQVWKPAIVVVAYLAACVAHYRIPGKGTTGDWGPQFLTAIAIAEALMDSLGALPNGPRLPRSITMFLVFMSLHVASAWGRAVRERREEEDRGAVGSASGVE